MNEESVVFPLLIKLHVSRLEMRSFKTLFLSLALCLWLSGCNSHIYATEAQNYTAALKQELERLGSCENQTSCPQVFWEAGGFQLGPIKTGGVTIAVYRVKDVAVAQALSERCKQLHAQAPQVSLGLVVYSTSHPGYSPHEKPVVIKNIRFSSQRHAG